MVDLTANKTSIQLGVHHLLLIQFEKKHAFSNLKKLSKNSFENSIPIDICHKNI